MIQSAQEITNKLEASVQEVMCGQADTIRRVLATLMAGGHVLLEDAPGTGKTTLAKAIAASIGGSHFQRIQFTPDLLPSDILGVSILEAQSSTFKFQPGPVFTDILLADEINRASPRTQSALLEAMAEGQATIEGKRHDLGDLFFVIATQNPVELRGTYPLPEAQMDRFALKCSLGYVSIEDELGILQAQSHAHPLDSLASVATREEVMALRAAVKEVRVEKDLQEYIVRLVAATRNRAGVKLAASPRASLNLLRVSQALTLFEGREFVIPETIQSLAPDVIAHRLVLEAYAGLTCRDVVLEVMEEVPVPV
ncbi:MoxR family ATPase [Akkermansiaceae bacterium]|nr:MoxR family ATPase [Akkermansiaceae bacterium]